MRKTSHTNEWTRRLAADIVGQLPEDHDEAINVLEFARRILDLGVPCGTSDELRTVMKLVEGATDPVEEESDPLRVTDLSARRGKSSRA